MADIFEKKGESQIIREMGKMETIFLTCHEIADLHVTVYSFHVSSQIYLQDYHVQTALNLLQRKLQHLQLCVSKLPGKLFFKEMSQLKVDYQRLENTDWHWLHEELLCKKFNVEKGPLWCCRMISLSGTQPKEQIGIQSDKRYKYVFLFSLLHAITDGTSNMRMMGHFMNILQRVIDGEDLSLQLIPIQNSMDGLLPRDRTKISFSDVVQMGKQLYEFFFPQTNSFVASFPPMKNVTARTRMLYREMDEESFESFRVRCKKSGATIHGAFCVAAAVAMHNMIKQNDTLDKVHKRFSIAHAVNFRRYIEADLSQAYGTYMIIVPFAIPVANDMSDTFWEHAASYTESLHDFLKGDKPFQTKKVIESCMKYPELFISSQKTSNNCKYEFGTTNMGQVDEHLKQGGYKDFDLTAIYRSTAFHYMTCTFDHSLQTYKGRLFYNLDYFTNFVSKELAKTYVDEIFRVLHEKIKG